MAKDSMNQKMTVVGRGLLSDVKLRKWFCSSVHGGAMSLSSCGEMNEGPPLTPTGWINRINLISFDSRGIDVSKLFINVTLRKGFPIIKVTMGRLT